MLLHRRTLPFLLSVGHGCIDLCQGAIPALLPILLVQRHLSYTAAAGLIFASNSVSSLIQPLFGHFADRLRAPWLLPVGLLVAGSGLALTSFFSQYWLIAVCMGISGVGIAAFHPEAARLVHMFAGKQKATAMSIFSLGGNVGFALAPLVMTVFLLLFGLRGTIALLFPLLGVALLLWSVSKQVAPVEKSEKTLEMSHLKNRSDDWGAFTRLAGAIVCRSIMFYGLSTFLTLYWMKVLHQSQTTGATALSVLLFTGLGGTLLGGRLADRYGRRRIVLLAFGVLFPVFLVFVLFSPVNMFFAWGLLIPVGMCLFAPFSVMVVMGQDYLPHHVGTASGVTLGLAVTVGGITAPVLGKIADLYGIAPALFGLACIPVLAVGCVLTLPREEIGLSPQKIEADVKEGSSKEEWFL